jgi:hypothetical protein
MMTVPKFRELKTKCARLGREVFWVDQETCHGELLLRFQEVGVETPAEAAILATIQSGYWPDWMIIQDDQLNKALQAHCLEVSKLPNFGTTLFGGYFEENWDE